MSLYCRVVGWWRTARHGVPISGCDYVEHPTGALVCRTCGQVSP